MRQHRTSHARAARFRHAVHASPLLLSLSLGLLLALSACGGAALPPRLTRATPSGSAEVSFGGVAYARALRVVTDLGLQPTQNACGVYSYVNNGVEAKGPWWQPLVTQTAYDRTPWFYVTTTPTAPPDWADRLRATSGVREVRVLQGPLSCPPNEQRGPIPPASLRLVASASAGLDTYVRVTFTAPAGSYDAVLPPMAALGFRLADPCFERGLTQGTAQVWHAMGQEEPFGHTRQLVLAVTALNALGWRDQLAATPGVASVDAPYAPTC